MAAWFGHTQTLTSISKSVSTVASGILGLEANLATFMQKVGYYEKFFARMAPNLPIEVMTTASRLFARCYEYRAEIRDELESSLAYVADAGRWVVGMEDWNSKMEKRLGQISELVLLANTLLVEFAVTGHWGAQDAKDALDGYLRHIADSVVLHNPSQSTKETKLASKSKSTANEVMENPLFPQATEASTDSTPPSATPSETNYNPLFPAPQATADESPLMSDNEELFLARSSVDSGVVNDAAVNGAVANESLSNTDDDDDVLNPFALAYQPPVSMESSLASLRAESDNGSVYYNAMDSHVMSGGGNSGDRDDGVEDEPDSPVSLGEYECLEMDSIPQYVAFKPTALSRKRRLKQQFFGGPTPALSPSASIDSLASVPGAPVTPPKGSPRITNGIKRTADPIKDRQRLMDLTYSYDFQRELTFNPFASPGMSTVPSTGTLPPPLDLSVRVPTVQEEESMFEIKEQVFGHDRASRNLVSEDATSTRVPDTPIVTVEEVVTADDDDVVTEVAPVLADIVDQIDHSTDPVKDLDDVQEPTIETLLSPPERRVPAPILPAFIEDDEPDSASSIDGDELAAVFYSAPEEFSRLLDEDPVDR